MADSINLVAANVSSHHLIPDANWIICADSRFHSCLPGFLIQSVSASPYFNVEPRARFG